MTNNLLSSLVRPGCLQTLLRHLLSNKENLKCAIIVNDMAELNIDATLVKNGALIQASRADYKPEMIDWLID